MLFNLFKKNSDPNEVVSCITYMITEDSNNIPIVNVEIKDYSEKSIKSLCRILDVLASDGSLAETVEIIKNAMINNGNEDNLIKIFSQISAHTRQKMLSAYSKNKNQQEPCIKPSDVFITK